MVVVVVVTDGLLLLVVFAVVNINCWWPFWDVDVPLLNFIYFGLLNVKLSFVVDGDVEEDELILRFVVICIFGDWIKLIGFAGGVDISVSLLILPPFMFDCCCGVLFIQLPFKIINSFVDFGDIFVVFVIVGDVAVVVFGIINCGCFLAIIWTGFGLPFVWIIFILFVVVFGKIKASIGVTLIDGGFCGDGVINIGLFGDLIGCFVNELLLLNANFVCDCFGSFIKIGSTICFCWGGGV